MWEWKPLILDKVDLGQNELPRFIYQNVGLTAHNVVAPDEKFKSLINIPKVRYADSSQHIITIYTHAYMVNISLVLLLYMLNTHL